MADHGHILRYAELANVIAREENIADHVLIYHDPLDSRTIEWKLAVGRPTTAVHRPRGVGTAVPVIF
jgi:hypothetical protein